MVCGGGVCGCMGECGMWGDVWVRVVCGGGGCMGGVDGVLYF